MKLRKVQLIRLLKNMIESYNVFTNDESLERKADAWYDKLQYQNEEFVTKVMNNWHGTKMPTAIDILKKCFELNIVRETEYSANNKLVCEYPNYSHQWENEESEISKSMCYHNLRERDRNNESLMTCAVNERIITVCWFHEKKIKSFILTNEESKNMYKNIVLDLMEGKKQRNASNLYSLTKDLATKLMVQ
jgi:hypothetical protein